MVALQRLNDSIPVANVEASVIMNENSIAT
jgi:hypothetical protein